MQAKNLEKVLQEVFAKESQIGVFSGTGYVLARPVGFSKASSLKVWNGVGLGLAGWSGFQGIVVTATL